MTPLLCIVESVADLMVIEQSLSYHGRYFILMGRLSPLNGVGPHEIGLDKLLERAGEPRSQRSYHCNFFTAEGEATAFAVSELLSKHYPQLKLTRIARGVPAGAEIEYTDVATPWRRQCSIDVFVKATKTLSFRFEKNFSSKRYYLVGFPHKRDLGGILYL